jgi:hypothetical protein
MVEQVETTVPRQRQSKEISETTNRHAGREELLNAVFSSQNFLLNLIGRNSGFILLTNLPAFNLNLNLFRFINISYEHSEIEAVPYPICCL